MVDPGRLGGVPARDAESNIIYRARVSRGRHGALRMVTGLLATGFLASVLVAAPARAQTPDGGAGPSSSQNAAELYQKGNQLFDSGDTKGAAASYLKAFDLNPRFDYAANLGAAQLQLGEWVDAAHHLAYAVAFVPGDLSAERREALNSRFEEAQSKVGAVRLRSQPDAQSIALDGKAPRVSAWRDLTFVTAGDHIATAEWADGSNQQAFTVEPGQSVDVVLSPLASPSSGAQSSGAQSSGAQASAADSEDAASGRPVWPIIGGVAATAVLAGVGATFTVIGAGQSGDADARRDAFKAEGRSCDGGCAELVDLYADADASYNTAIPFFIGSGVALLSTAAYVLFVPDGGEQADAAALRVSVGMGSVAVSGRY